MLLFMGLTSRMAYWQYATVMGQLLTISACGSMSLCMGQLLTISVYW